MSKNQAIEHAVNDLRSQNIPNIDATAKKCSVTKSILQHHYKNQTVSYSKNQSKSNMLLTNIRKKFLIEHINKLSIRNLHPTIQTVKNLIKKIISHVIKK